jgi:hypothetical protein
MDLSGFQITGDWRCFGLPEPEDIAWMDGIGGDA